MFELFVALPGGLGTSNDSWGVPVIEALMPFLKQINVTVKPQQLEGAALAPRMQKLDYEAFIWSLSSGAGGGVRKSSIRAPMRLAAVLCVLYMYMQFRQLGAFHCLR